MVNGYHQTQQQLLDGLQEHRVTPARHGFSLQNPGLPQSLSDWEER
jgi:hypothetical protein